MLPSRLRDVFFENAAKEWETLIETIASKQLTSMTLFQSFRDPNERDLFLKVFIVADEFQLMC